MYSGLHVKCPIFLANFNQIWILFTDFNQPLISDVKKLRPVGTKSIYVDRQTDGRIERPSYEALLCDYGSERYEFRR